MKSTITKIMIAVTLVMMAVGASSCHYRYYTSNGYDNWAKRHGYRKEYNEIYKPKKAARQAKRKAK